MKIIHISLLFLSMWWSLACGESPDSQSANTDFENDSTSHNLSGSHNDQDTNADSIDGSHSDTGSNSNTDILKDTDTSKETNDGTRGKDYDELTSIQFDANGYTFEALIIGPADGEPVLLLHGFPDISLMWTSVMEELGANGYRCLAPDQRGYSPGARPTEVDDYKYDELIADGFAFGNEMLGEKFHLVAHDWGANIAWLMLERDPLRIASFVPIAIPHYRVWAALALNPNDDEMAIYRDYLLPNWMEEGTGEESFNESGLRRLWPDKPADQLEMTIAVMTEPGAMTAALNWYRANDGHQTVLDNYTEDWEVSNPTLLIFGSEDMGQSSVANTAQLMKGPYTLFQPEGGHFIIDEKPEEVTAAILQHLQENPIQ